MIDKLPHDECFYCERRHNLQMQICGFWFCFRCLDRAVEMGAYYWYRMRG
jgi:hypothetical protein